MIGRLPLAPLEPCQSCRSPCCVGRVVYLSSLDVYRIASVVGLDWTDFSFSHPTTEGGFLADIELGRMTHRVRLRHTYEGACLLAVVTPEGTLRCGVASLRPGACRMYPYNVQLFAQQPYMVAIGNNAACPSFGTRWFQQNIDPLGDEIDAAVADAALAAWVEARWNALIDKTPPPVEIGSYFRWAWEVYSRIGAPNEPERGSWQLSAYRQINAFDLSLLPTEAT